MLINVTMDIKISTPQWKLHFVNKSILHSTISLPWKCIDKQEEWTNLVAQFYCQNAKTITCQEQKIYPHSEETNIVSLFSIMTTVSIQSTMVKNINNPWSITIRIWVSQTWSEKHPILAILPITILLFLPCNILLQLLPIFSQIEISGKIQTCLKNLLIC